MLGVGMKSHRGCYNITLLQPTTKQCRLSLEIKHMGAQAAAPNNSAASVGTLGVGGGDARWPIAQIWTTLPLEAIKRSPNQERKV